MGVARGLDDDENVFVASIGSDGDFHCQITMDLLCVEQSSGGYNSEACRC